MFKKTLVITLLVFSFLIFGLWIDAKIITSNFDYPNNGLFLEIDDSKIFYRQLGEGPNIIFLHGIGASQFIWNDVAEELKQKYHLTIKKEWDP